MPAGGDILAVDDLECTAEAAEAHDVTGRREGRLRDGAIGPRAIVHQGVSARKGARDDEPA